MSNNDRVTHSVRGYTMKFGQVQKRMAENSCFVWIVYGESFRDATIAEAAQMRKEQPKVIEPIPFAEIPGLIYQPAERNQTLTNQGYALIQQANRFCLEHASS